MDTQEEQTGLTSGHLLDPSQRHDLCMKHASCRLQNQEGSHPQRDSLAACLGGNTHHCQGTPPQHSPCSDPSFLAFSWACCTTLPSQIPRIPSCHQYNWMCYLHSFAGKTHQVRSRPAGGWAIFDIHPERRCIPLTRDEHILEPFAQAAGDIERLLRQPPTRTAPIHPSRQHLLRQYMLSPNSRSNTLN